MAQARLLVFVALARKLFAINPMRTILESILVICLIASATLADTRHITPTQIAAVVQAVQDEIYDYGFETDYLGVGKNVSSEGQKWKSRTPIDIRPDIEGGEGVAIYDLKHYGEVYRLFVVQPNGIVVLDGDPEHGFPPTQTSFLARYMNATKLARLKHEWIHASFEVDTNVRDDVVRDSARRQKQRTGFSYWESVVLPNRKGKESVN